MFLIMMVQAGGSCKAAEIQDRASRVSFEHDLSFPSPHILTLLLISVSLSESDQISEVSPLYL